MTIKSDRWIISQCTAPTFMVSERRLIPAPISSDGFEMGTVNFETVEYPTHASEAEVNAMVWRNCNVPMSVGIIAARPPTAKELADFKPMIESFSPQQVREVERNSIEQEELRLKDFVKMTGQPVTELTKETVASLLGKSANLIRHDPLLGLQIRQKIISYGVSSYGYDLRCSDDFKIFTNLDGTVINPKRFDENCFVKGRIRDDGEGRYVLMPPHSFALARSVEYWRIPRSVLTVCVGKSTYARCGIIVNVTPFEPEWEGHVTLEFSNTTPLPAMIYIDEGCAQVLFFESDEPCLVSYKDRKGKYQGQMGVTPPMA